MHSPNNHALTALKLLAFEYRDEDDDSVHFSFTDEELQAADRATAIFWRDPIYGQLNVTVEFGSE